MKPRIALIALILITLIGGYFWHSNQPRQKIRQTVDQFIEAVEYDSTKLRKREDVHEAVKSSTADTVSLKVSELPFDLEVPRKMAFESLCSRLDLLHSMTSEREFETLEEEIQLIGNKAQLTRISKITMAMPLREQKAESWELVFDLELKEQWKITAIRARRHQ
ncbi:MAG: hypothetical protein ABF379_01725 [Akkermansiaceae bacterium]|jgi:hypothetical protein